MAIRGRPIRVGVAFLFAVGAIHACPAADGAAAVANPPHGISAPAGVTRVPLESLIPLGPGLLQAVA